MTTINGTTGEISATFPHDELGISKICDINNDGDDEIYRNAGYMYTSEVHIYHVVNDATGINDDNSQIPSSFRLYPAYPNPFNASTTIQYDLVKNSPVEISIYNIMGQKIETLVDQRQEAGHHQVIWDASYVSSGIYFYKITAGDFTETKKMVLIK
jgi:hypothetical protein